MWGARAPSSAVGRKRLTALTAEYCGTALCAGATRGTQQRKGPGRAEKTCTPCSLYLKLFFLEKGIIGSRELCGRGYRGCIRTGAAEGSRGGASAPSTRPVGQWGPATQPAPGQWGQWGSGGQPPSQPRPVGQWVSGGQPPSQPVGPVSQPGTWQPVSGASGTQSVGGPIAHLTPHTPHCPVRAQQGCPNRPDRPTQWAGRPVSQ